MNNTIHMYPLRKESTESLRLPAGARILSIQMQGSQLCLWALVDGDMPAVKPHTIVIYGTGHFIPDVGRLEYVATVPDGSFVWHVFTTKR